MDGISIYTHVSQGWQKPDLGAGQQGPGGAREEKGVESTSRGESINEKPSRAQDKVTLSAEAQQKLRELSVRDQEVRAHEAAHAAIGGRYAGSPRLSYEEGPDGRRYATSGQVSIDTSEVPGDPDKTLQKAETVKRAALAPQNPSSADLAIAAKATQLAAKARMEMSAEKNESLQNGLKGAFFNANPDQSDPFEKNTDSSSEQPDFRVRGQLLSVRT